MGRRSIYTPELANEIIERISNGEPLKAICRDEHMPTWSVVYRWIRDIPDFATEMNIARDMGADAIAEEALSIADTPVIGEETEYDGEKRKVKRGDMLGHRKLQVETRLKLLAKWHPKKYGDKTAMELTGADGGPVAISDTERAAKIASILAEAKARKEGYTGDVSDLI